MVSSHSVKTLVIISVLFVWAVFPQDSIAQYTATKQPDRFNLSFYKNPAISFAVNWRTDSTMVNPIFQVAIAVDSTSGKKGGFEILNKSSYRATTEELIMDGRISLHHSYKFIDGLPETVYAFRVGEEGYWSEWIQHKTADDSPKPFSFIYLGDAQNNIKSLWSRTIRQAFRDEPYAAFVLHAGDLINERKESEWDEWFYAGSFIHTMIPIVPVTGNHEHIKLEGGKVNLISNWTQQFTLPDNGPTSSQETDYYVDYQGVRIVVLNSELFIHDPTYRSLQKNWLHRILKRNPNKWTLISYHHPMSEGVLVKELKPILEMYDVDLAMQGHVHSYSRGITWNKDLYTSGPVYTVSVSGPKHYPLNPLNGLVMMRSGQDMQLYQIIHCSSERIEYKAYTVTGKIYDHFEIVKNEKSKHIINHIKD